MAEIVERFWRGVEWGSIVVLKRAERLCDYANERGHKRQLRAWRNQMFDSQIPEWLRHH